MKKYISDMVKERISDFSVITHMAAKGSNSFIRTDIVAFYNALSPPLFCELGALNARFGRGDLVRLFYVDRFEQTAGRNRGYRGQPGSRRIQSPNGTECYPGRRCWCGHSSVQRASFSVMAFERFRIKLATALCTIVQRIAVRIPSG
jgi:hypothetical protein